MKLRVTPGVLALLILAGAGGRLNAQQFDFTVPSDDQWQYPYNPDPPNRSPGSCFGTVGYDHPPFNYKFNNRDGIVLVAWDTSSLIPTGQGPSSYTISAIQVTLRNIAGAQWPADLTVDDAPRMHALMSKYRDLPMDLADAAIVTVAEREGVRQIFTLDRRDFSVYRPRLGQFIILP